MWNKRLIIGTRPSTIVRAGEVFKRVLLCVQGGPKGSACQQDLKLGRKARCQMQMNKGKLESMRKNSSLPASPRLHTQPCEWHAGRRWQPSPPSHTYLCPKPQKSGRRSAEVRHLRPTSAPCHHGSWQINTHMWNCTWQPTLTLWV